MYKQGIAVIAAVLLTLTIFYSAACADQGQALRDAAKRGDLARVKTLLDEGVEVDAKNENGVTALMEAYGGGHSEIIKLLLEWEADIDAKDIRTGITILMAASTLGQTEVVKLLLEWEADINAKADNGATALIMASFQGHIDVAKLLLEAKADVNAKTNNGATALLAASQKGHTKVVELLKTHGAKE